MKTRSPKRNNSHRLRTAVLFCLFFFLLALSRTATAQNHPNIVIILADDLGYDDVGFNGSPDIPTPNLDALAANGALCTDGYVTAPYCSPSRAGLLTGRYQQRFGYDSEPEQDNDNPLQGLPLTEYTLAELLKPAGYVCGIYGKWHVGVAPDLFPLERGFDEFVGFLGSQSRYYNAVLYRNNTTYTETRYLTDAFTQEAVAFIQEHASQPFFLYLAYNAVHAPYDQAPEVYQEKVSYITDPDRRNYAAMAVALDVGVGQVIQTLQDNDLLNNTLIFFLSDNGAPNNSFTNQSNYPLRGFKLDTLEGGIRIPFAVQWMGQLPAHTVYSGMVSSLDLTATAAAAAGVSLPSDRVYDGMNLLPFLEGQERSPKRNLFWRWFGLGPDGPLGSLTTIWAVRSGDYKLVVPRLHDDLPPALYNLAQDIGETSDLASQKPQTVASLQSLYDNWQLDTLPSAWQNDNDSQLLPLVLAGDWNGFNKDDLNPPWNLTRITAPAADGSPDGYNWLTNTIHVATTGGDTTPGIHQFTVVGAETYATQWGGTTVNINAVTNIPAYSGDELGPPNTISFDDGFYYSMRIIDSRLLPEPGQTLPLAVMKTSAPPVTVARASQVPRNPGPTDPITVNISTSQSKSPEENIYVRWSTDSFISSHIVSATGSGTSYVATIPSQAAGTHLLYTIVTSTVDLTSYSGSGVIDSLLLDTSVIYNGYPPVLPSIVRQPADQTVAVGEQATFTVQANGTKPFAYQWNKNSAPIFGATHATYVTAPARRRDDGTVFSVTISNRVGRITSDGAVLTVQ